MNNQKLIAVTSAHIEGSGRFVARDHFRVAVSGEDVVVQISHIGQGFNQFLIDRVEDPSDQQWGKNNDKKDLPPN